MLKINDFLWNLRAVHQVLIFQGFDDILIVVKLPLDHFLQTQDIQKTFFNHEILFNICGFNFWSWFIFFVVEEEEALVNSFIIFCEIVFNIFVIYCNFKFIVKVTIGSRLDGDVNGKSILFIKTLDTFIVTSRVLSNIYQSSLLISTYFIKINRLTDPWPFQRSLSCFKHHTNQNYHQHDFNEICAKSINIIEIKENRIVNITKPINE